MNVEIDHKLSYFFQNTTYQPSTYIYIYIYIDCISFTHFKRNTKQTPCITASLAPTFSAR